MVTELASWVETYGTAAVLAVGGAVIGVLFGYLPAKRAAQLDPVDALTRQ